MRAETKKNKNIKDEKVKECFPFAGLHLAFSKSKYYI